MPRVCKDEHSGEAPICLSDNGRRDGNDRRRRANGDPVHERDLRRGPAWVSDAAQAALSGWANHMPVCGHVAPVGFSPDVRRRHVFATVGNDWGFHAAVEAGKILGSHG
jgi:hypothetical protein